MTAMSQRGYLLLPVAIMIAVIAAIALLINYESSLETNTTVSELDSRRAAYVAEAGLVHGQWLATRQSCGPFSNLTNQPLGGDAYTTSLTTDLGATASYTLVTDHDAWIDSDNPGINKGGDAALRVTNVGGVVNRPVYHFDLSPLPADAAILSAIAWFYVVKQHPDSPVDLHRINADWTETDATWNTLGDEMDDEIVASIPAQPNPNVRVAVNLTAQVQAWVNGDANRGITLNYRGEATLAEYSSKEHSEAPYISVVVGAAPDPEAQLTATGNLANGIDFKIKDKAFTLTQFPPLYQELQPDGSSGHDTYLDDSGPTTNWGSDARIRISNKTNAQKRGLLRFDLSRIPLGAKVSRATLELNLEGIGSGGIASVDLHRVTTAWNELQATWNDAATATTWNSPGGDWQSTVEASATIDAAFPGPTTWDLTGLVAGWIDGSLPNEGIFLLGSAGVNHADFTASNSTDPALRPKLSVTFTCACGIVCVPAASEGEILFVVDNAGGLTNRESDYVELFGELGYEVDLLSDHDAWWNFDNKAADNDVVFVSRNVNPSAWGFADKVRDTSLGVLLDKSNMLDDLGFAAANTTGVGDTLATIDAAHEITRIFAPAGELRIFDGAMDLRGATGSAPGAQVLAQHAGVDALLAIDAGEALGGALAGQNAVGRRVMLPFTGSSDFNLARLNNNGRLLLQRSLDWAQYATCTPQWSEWRVAASEDDAEENLGVVSIDSSDLELVRDAIVNQTVGIRFRDVAIPAGATIVEAYLDFTVDETDTGWTSVNFEGEAVTDAAPFVESGSNISSRARTTASVSWSGIPAWNTVGEVHTSPDLAPLLREVVNAPGWAANNALAIIVTGSGTRTAEAYDGSPPQAPLLRVAYCATLPTNPQLLMVVVDDTNLTVQEDAKRSLFESWGYSVNPLSASAVQADYDSAVAANDVVFIGEDVDSSQVGGKLVDAAIGVVTEEANLSDEFGFSDSIVWGSGTDLSIAILHYITETVGLGDHNVLTTSESLAALAGTVAPGLQALASTPDGVALAALDAGASITLGRTAAGRRVFLPWGGNDMDINHLNASGLTLLQRALEWAGGAGVGNPTRPIAHWKLDETSGTTALDSTGGNDGTLQNGPAWTPGAIDGGLAFDGIDDIVDAGTFDVVGSGITMMAWFRADAIASDDPRFVSKSSGPNEADALWQLSTTDSGSDRYLRMRIRAGGTTTTLADASTIISLDEWHFAAATYDAASGEMKLYLDGVVVANDTHLVTGSLDIDPSVPVALGANGTAERFFDGLLDDVRIYNYALDENKISDLYAENQPVPASYTELYQPWTANTPDNWETVNLAGFNVPADAVVEVAVINTATSAQRWGGVRAVGSTVDRRIQLHEAEAGGFDMVTMHVQADASSQIQHYSDNTGQISFILLGYWIGASYTDALEPFTANAQGSWIAEGVGDDGVGPNQVAEILIVNTDTGAERLAGVRAPGSTHQRRFMLQEAESGGVDALSMMVTADASSSIEVYSGNTGDIDFYVLGTWDVAPGTYTGTGGAHGSVSAPSTWETIDLTSYGVPADSIAQFVLANENAGLENSMRVREVGSTINNRGLDLHEAEAGGSDLGTLHANVNASSEVQWAAELGSANGYFYPVGWWVLSP